MKHLESKDKSTSDGGPSTGKGAPAYDAEAKKNELIKVQTHEEIAEEDEEGYTEPDE